MRHVRRVGHWHAVARGSLREALFETHRNLAEGVLQSTRETDPAKAVARWLTKHESSAAHVRAVITDLRAQTTAVDFASLSVALQAVRRIAVADA